MSSNLVKYLNRYRFKDGILFKPVMFIFDILVDKVLLKKVNVKFTGRYYRSSKETKCIQDTCFSTSFGSKSITFAWMYLKYGVTV